MKAGGQLNCILNEIYDIICAGKTLPLAFFINDGYKGENNLSPLILDVTLEYALRRIIVRSCVVQRQLCSVRTLFIC